MDLEASDAMIRRLKRMRYTKPTLPTKRRQSSITSPVSTTPAAATPPPTPTALRMHCSKISEIRPLNPDLKVTYPSHAGSENGTHGSQQCSPDIAAIEQNLQSGHVVDDDRPGNGTGAARQIIIPHKQKQRKELCEARDQQSRADERFVRVVRYHGGQRAGKLDAEQSPDGHVEGSCLDCTQGQEEQVLQ